MSINVDYNTFWELNPKKLSLFVEAEKIKIKNQDNMNYMLGHYIRMAIASTLSNKAKYPKEPFMIASEKYQNQKFDEDLFMAQLKQWADKHNENIRKNKKQTMENESR